MQVSDDCSEQLLRWVQPERSRSYLVLCRGSVELATVERDQQRPTQILATWGKESWLFVGQQLFDPAVKIYPGPTCGRTAQAQPLAWLDHESCWPELRLLLAAGRCYSWLWQRDSSEAYCTCRLASPQGTALLLRIQMPASQRTSAPLRRCKLLLFPSAKSLPDLPLLIVLSPYLLLLGQQLSGPPPRRCTLLAEDVAAEVLEALAAFLGELLGHLH
ncbi:hypothetical protein [Thermogemmatispora sp.]|uniref:hypothetical protein n=1 Tax=Thermogemmatispora sp. TaxID=1968838 RepID=UPI001D6CF34A|nr:hypothetical protein [Thermogemmatispora sp.]MBX5451021.1 hypothetical protein [Thermogemmatispora sp.]